MPIAKMQKIELFGIKRKKRQVIDLMQELGLVELKEVDEKISLDREVNYDAFISALEFAVSFLEPFEEKRESFFESLSSARKDLSYKDIKERVSKLDFKGLINECRSLERELQNLDELEKNLRREFSLLIPWKSLEFPLEDLKDSKYVDYFTGMIAPQNIDPLEKELKGTEASLEIINQTKLEAYVLIACSKGNSEKVSEILPKFDFLQIDLPVSHRAPEEELENILVSEKEAKDRRSVISDVAARLAKKRFDLMIAHDFFVQKLDVQSVERNLKLTEYTFRLQGFVMKKELPRLKNSLKERFPETLVIEIDPDEDEEIPVAIENRPKIRPFETITNIYGLPGYNDIDPSPLLAAFFIVFFGVCLGDAGYGITLTIVALFLYKKMGKSPGAGRLLKLLAYGGVATFLAGVVTGGWFGVQPNEFPAFLKPAQDFLNSIRIIDPVENPIGMLIVALSFGVIQLIFGIIVSFYMKLRDKEYLDAILDDGLWIYFLTVLVLFAIDKSGAVKISAHISKFVIVGAGLLVLTQGRKAKNPFLKVVFGIGSLYKTVGYLSDVLSYSRILALGLATSIIAMVVNMISVMTKDVPIIGYFFMALVLIVGHTFNIAVNVLGAFIHSARLQFVEFFSKFLQGGGTEFKPLKRRGKFIEVKD